MHRLQHVIFIILGLTALGLSASPAVAQGAPAPPSQRTAPNATAETPRASYEVTFTGLERAGELRGLMEASAELVKQQDDPPQARAGLRRRADGDVERFETAANSLGYYDASFTVDIKPGVEPSTFVVTVQSDPGPLYTISEITIEPVGHEIGGVEIPTKRLGIALGDPAKSGPVLAAEGNIVRFLQENGRPLAKSVDRKVLVDHRTQNMQVTYQIDPGPPARFGPVSVAGATQVDPTFILRRLPWTYGDKANVQELEAGRDALIASGVFSSATVSFAEEVEADGLLPVVVTVTERKRRSIGAGVSYSTSDGAASTAFWTHRNLFGGAERLDLRATLGQVETSTSASLRIPDVLFNDQDLVLSSSAISEQTDNYDSVRYIASATFDRRLSDILSVDYGISFERSRIDDDGKEEQFTLVGLPLGTSIDTSDDLLNPTRGGRSRFTYTPYLETIGSTVEFHAFTARHSHYLKLDSEGDVVLAGRAAIGSIMGASTSNIPADKRMYSGGAGSVRGYALQAIGPQDSGNEATGGRSKVEFGAELRWRFYEDFGIVPFIDAGQVYDNEFPTLDTEMQWAAGLGFRYYTPIGPIRADFAVPLNPRSSDDSFQLYFSLGQAF